MIRGGLLSHRSKARAARLTRGRLTYQCRYSVPRSGYEFETKYSAVALLVESQQNTGKKASCPARLAENKLPRQPCTKQANRTAQTKRRDSCPRHTQPLKAATKGSYRRRTRELLKRALLGQLFQTSQVQELHGAEGELKKKAERRTRRRRLMDV